MSARASLIFLSLVASAASAAPTIDPQFGTHAVIERGKPILLSGTAAPNEHVSVVFAAATRQAVADSSGSWRTAFPASPAGGPYTIKVTGSSGGMAASDDVMVGDVWLCSGQSNMEYPVRRALNSDGEVQSAGDPNLRLFKVPQQVADDPQEHFAKPPQWQVTSPDSVRDFSAACYFMARELRASQKVPIGAIDDSWGSTPVRQWMDEASVRAGGEAQLAELVRRYRTNPTQALREFDQTWARWWQTQAKIPSGEEPWHASDRLSWQVMPPIGYLSTWGPEWKDYVGAFWARRRLTLTAAEAARSATLSLGVLDDVDQAWVNGVPVGGTNDWAADRLYPVPPGVLHSGNNEIILYVRNAYGPGGFIGPAEKVHLDLGSGRSVPLPSGWQVSRIDKRIADAPTPPWTGVASVSKIYNAMISPFGPLGLRGVAWYQGEADVGVPGYDRRLAAFMRSWRNQFHDPNLPFLIVGLAGWGKPSAKPIESGWAALINEQRLAVTHDHRAALISAIDLGVPTDIHPSNKQEVGRRLALAGSRIAYSDQAGTIGPFPVTATRGANAITVTFNKALQTLSGNSAIAFELCGTAPGSCRFTDARVRGNSVELAIDGKPVAKVRYAWADYPIVNLYDLDQLPAPVFELPVQ